jgi:hypothetical protein
MQVGVSIHGRRATVMERSNDDERVAALLDGKLDERQRQEVLALLVKSGEDYDVFADTAAVLRELEAQDASAAAPAGSAPARVPAAVLPPTLRPRAPRWGRATRWGGLAAGVVVIALGATFSARQGVPAAADPVRLAARLGNPGQGLPPGWQPLGSSSRGDTQSQERHARAVRAGALLVDLAVAVRAGDASNTRLLSDRIRSRYDRGAGPGSPFRQLSRRAGAPADSLQPLLSRATERLSESLGRDYLRLGAWTEAARLAARAQDQEFFREADAVPRAAGRLTARNPAAAQALERVQTALPRDGPPRWEALRPALDSLQGALAGGR